MPHEERIPFVPGFREDVFLSYAHVDNEEGWVSDLHVALDTRLRALLGPNVRTWRDLKLHAGDALWETLEPIVSGSAVFVAILSPPYVLSRACLREAAHFRETAKTRGELVGTTCRFVQVVKTPFEHQPESRFLKEVESIQSRFYMPNKLDELRFTAFPSRENLPHYEDFYTKVEELAQSLAGILQKMRARLTGPEPSVARVSATVPEEAKVGEAPRVTALAALEPRHHDATRPLTEALEKAFQRKEDLAVGGSDTRQVDQEILELHRLLREGGRLKTGDMLAHGRFRLIEPLGRGGFATVWKAYDRRDKTYVAVKVLHNQFGEDRTRLDRFFRGARKMGELNHPGIVRVLERRLEDGGYHFFVMEYVPGGDLRQGVLEKRIGLEPAMILLREVAAALQFAHEKGVIHRDVKPANILLDDKGRPKLTDFDLVRAFDTTGGTLMGGGMMGTFLYTAPEVMYEPGEATPAADVYSLSMTAAFCFSGAELPLEVLENREAFLRRLPCSTGIRAALKKAMTSDPEKRFGSVAEFIQALDSVPQIEEDSRIHSRGRYRDCEIRIRAAPNGGYRSEIISPFGEADSAFKLPSSVNRLSRLPDELERLGTDVDGKEMSAQSSEEIGHELFRSLFSGEVGRLFQRSLATLADHKHEGLRIRLRFDLDDPTVAALASLPWELLFDVKRNEFLSRKRQTPLMRYFPMSRLPLPPVHGPLRVLVMQAAPSGMPALNLEKNWREICGALHGHSGLELALMEHTSLIALREKLLAGPWHVLHFMGHGGFNRETGQGFLWFEDSDGHGQAVTGSMLGETLKSFPDLRLIFLEGSEGTDENPYIATATALVRTGVPAVIAMQAPILGDAVIDFIYVFYRRLASGDPVDAAAVEGRLAIRSQGIYDWATPVLFSRIPDGDLLIRSILYTSESKGIPSGREKLTSPLRLGIRSFLDKSETWDEEMNATSDVILDLRDLFGREDSRYIKEPIWWQTRVIPKLRDFLASIPPSPRPLYLNFAAHASIAFAAGYFLEAKSGFDITIRQRTQAGIIDWRTRVGEPSEEPILLQQEDIPSDAGAHDVAVALGITRSLVEDVRSYLSQSSLPVRRVLPVTVAAGPTQSAVLNGRHALQLAQSIEAKIRRRSVEEREGIVHLFASAPNVLLFLLGQLARGLGRIQLYEYDFISGTSGAYNPSILLPPTEDRHRTEERCQKSGTYAFDGFTDATWSPAPAANERLIMLKQGEVFPPSRVQNRACWWKFAF